MKSTFRAAILASALAVPFVGLPAAAQSPGGQGVQGPKGDKGEKGEPGKDGKVVVEKDRDWFGPRPPMTPSPTQIQGRQAAMKDALDGGDGMPPMSPAQYTATGYVLVKAECNRYFDVLIRDQNLNAFRSDTVNSTGRAFVSFLGFADASPGDIGRAGTVFGLFNDLLRSFRERALVTPYPVETKTMIIKALSAYEEAAPPDTVKSKEQADSLVESYAEICSYSGITRFAGQALSAAKPELVNGSPAEGLRLSSSGKLMALVVAQMLGAPELTDEQAALLYIYTVKEPKTFTENPEAAKYILARLPKGISDKLLGDQDNYLDPLAGDPPPLNAKAISLLAEIAGSGPGFNELIEAVEKSLPGAAPSQTGADLEALDGSGSTTALSRVGSTSSPVLKMGQ